MSINNVFRDFMTGSFYGCLVSGFWFSGFYLGFKTRVEEYEREIKKLKKQLKPN